MLRHFRNKSDKFNREFEREYFKFLRDIEEGAYAKDWVEWVFDDPELEHAEEDDLIVEFNKWADMKASDMAWDELT